MGGGTSDRGPGWIRRSQRQHLADQKSPEALKTPIHSWLNSKVSNHKRHSWEIHFVREIPKSPSGKILG